MTDILTKTEFAELCGVTPARVSQWLSEGKIGPDALVGEGRRAKINVAMAQTQIRERTDIGQRFGNGLTTNLGEDQPPAAGAAKVPTLKSTTDLIADQKLRQAEIETRRKEVEELRSQGTLMTTSSARAAVVNAVAVTVREWEGGLVDMASRLSSDFALNQRDVLHSLKSEFNSIRAKSAEKAATRRDALDKMNEVADLSELEVVSQ